MKILPVSRENFADFQSLYVEFFREFRGKQGWSFDEGELKRGERILREGKPDIHSVQGRACRVYKAIGLKSSL